MKNMFKVAAVAFASLVAVTAKAEALYWQVDQGVTYPEFEYAILNVTGGELGNNSQRLAAASAEGTAPNQYVSVQNTDISSYASDTYSFFVELANYNNDSWKPVKAGTPVSYTALQSGGYVATSFQEGLKIAQSGGYNMGQSVPEPTSGLLLLMGGAMLALRRRRRV